MKKLVFVGLMFLSASAFATSTGSQKISTWTLDGHRGLLYMPNNVTTDVPVKIEGIATEALCKAAGNDLPNILGVADVNGDIQPGPAMTAQAPSGTKMKVVYTFFKCYEVKQVIPSLNLLP